MNESTSLPGEFVKIKKGELFDCNEAFVTKYTCSNYRTMTFEEFKRDIVPTLEEQNPGSPFYHYEIRDLYKGNYFVLDHDGVIQYKVDSVIDSTYDNFITNLKMSDRTEGNIKRDIINSPFPVYSWGTSEGMWEMGVKIPETKFRYKSSITGDRTIYMPPVLYTVQGTSTGQYRHAFIKVITQDSISHKLMKFGELSLPNVAPGSGHICVGSSSVVGSSSNNVLTPAQIVAMSWDLFIGSNWNTDYISSAKFPSNLMEVADKYKVDVKEHNSYMKRLIILLTLLETKGVWEELEWAETN